MRGSHFFRYFDQLIFGIIPAHAGLTAYAYIVENANGDHPRACGAHVASPMRTAARPGSSPRMRGSPKIVAVADIILWIIPAHAGLTERDGH